MKLAAPKEGGHWYTQGGRLVETVTGVRGAQVRPDIRHARKHQFAPGVTTIIKVADKPQLTVYRERQVLLAAATEPRIPGETDADWVDRVMVSAREHAKNAAEEGTAIHGRVERGLADPDSGDPWVQAVRMALSGWAGDLDWACVTPCVHENGFATKSDLNCRRGNGLVVDIKTKDGSLDALQLWDEHYQQLAATREALDLPYADCAIVFVSRTEPAARLAIADFDGLEHGWSTFKACLHLWQTKNRYRPSWATRIDL